MASLYGMTGIAAPSAAGQGLGLGDLLGQQQQDETEEQRKKRLAGQQDEPGTSAAVKSLFNTFDAGLGGGLGSSLGGRGRVGI
jgi:hypothetical protein